MQQKIFDFRGTCTRKEENNEGSEIDNFDSAIAVIVPQDENKLELAEVSSN